MIGGGTALLETEHEGFPITMIGFPLRAIYHSPLPHTYTLSFLYRHPESFRPVTSAPTHLF